MSTRYSTCKHKVNFSEIVMFIYLNVKLLNIISIYFYLMEWKTGTFLFYSLRGLNKMLACAYLYASNTF